MSMTPGADARATIEFSWPPQRKVDLALAVSGLAALACLALVVLRRRGRADPDEPPSPVLAPDPWSAPRAPLVASALVVLVGTAFASIGVGLALAVFAVGVAFAARHRWLAIAVRALPVAAIAGGVAYVVLQQERHDYPHSALWPSEFRLAHSLVFFGLLAVALLVLADRPEDLGDLVEPDTP